MNTLNNIQIHPRLSGSLDKDQIESLGKNLDFLLDFVESYNYHRGINKEELVDLEIQIASAAHEFEDVIESRIVDQILRVYTPNHGETSSRSKHVNRRRIITRKKKLTKVLKESPFVFSHLGCSTPDHGETSSKSKHANRRRIKPRKENNTKVLKESPFDFSHLGWLFALQKVILDMDFIKEKVLKFKEERGLKDEKPANSMAVASSGALATEKTTMVGFDGYFIQLLERLTTQQSDRQIIPIAGMGGIGKTTLAKNVFEDSLVVQYFYVRAWITVSQECNVREILFGILSCLTESTSGMDVKTDEELGEQVYKILFDRRYLIVLDDMWSVEAWEKLKTFFPENYNRSRIVVTTRQADVASHFSSLGLALNFLDEDKSWVLFCTKAFPQEGCPPEFEKIGRNIVRKCKGLPLSIVVIGGLLRKSPMAQEYWENVENDLISILNSVEDNQCFNILSLSYSHLPTCLKPCFLYLGTFPEDHEIRISKLIKLWIAEGFIKLKVDQSQEVIAGEYVNPNRGHNLEDVAKGYIKDLIDRNLILVHELGTNGKFKTCKIHDLLRDLCIKVAERDKFFCVVRNSDSLQDIDGARRIVIHGSMDNKIFYATTSASTSKSLVRSVISKSWCSWLPISRFLRVLYNVYADLHIISWQVNLRLLLFSPVIKHDRNNTYRLPPSISLLWNLQTIASTGTAEKVIAPSEIWEMTQLRHLEFMLICLPDPPQNDGQDCIVLQNLQTLGRVLNFMCNQEACKRMPNLKKLSLSYDDFWGEGKRRLSNYGLFNISCFKKLESLDCYFREVPYRVDLLQNIRFPRSLKKLVLRNCGLQWTDLRIIGSLPHLEVLRLVTVVGSEWNSVEGEFLRLKYLGISWCSDLVYLNVENSHFPVLEKLDLSCLMELEELPLCIGDIPTLNNILVDNCSISAAISVLKILKEQECLGNESLRVQIKFWNERKMEEFKEKMEKWDFTSLNYQLILIDE